MEIVHFSKKTFQFKKNLAHMDTIEKFLWTEKPKIEIK
jgi:hypothetical protein